ncbi:MAG: CheR family methyltransferase, partial [Desulfosalsimonadaceae bacterium]|nr:CheR family methyltransferase [Desulfosalsimonadaceae bacterium]
MNGTKKRNNFPSMVAGIGVPADGFTSLNRFFDQMTSGHGAAFVVLHPSGSRHVGLTIQQLKDRTTLTVVEAEDGMAVIPDRIYVMSSDKFLNIAGCRLTFREPVECNGMLMPIDHFFCSLATDLGALSCGILLSPVGSDGLLGLSELKAAGGRTFVEDPGGEASPGSPQNLPIADRVLSVDAMAAEIAALAKLAKTRSPGGLAASLEFDQDLRVILDIVRTRVGHDFSAYKPSTMVRRIRRRMTLAKVAQYTDYARFLYEHPDEADLLQKDLLIGVTEFFRQPQAWENLEKMVIAPLVEKAPPGAEIRIWVPGCSTGKEAYSLAMLLMEHMEKTQSKIGFQIFATDSEAASLAVARSGIYSDAELGENVSMERRQRFFTHPDSNYQIVKEIRERIVFAPQNLMADPPFSRLDLISCRNLLIYLDQKVQQKIIALFHFSLREGGFLFLGTAETVGEREDLFAPVSKKWRIYRRIGVGRRVGIEIPLRPAGDSLPGQGKLPQAALPPRLSLASAAHQMLLDRFAPACVMIDRKHQVLYVHGPVDNYLTFPPGELTMRVVDMVREGLRARLRGAIGKCIEVGRPVSVTARVRRKDKSVPVRAIVSPIRYPRETDGLLLITFEDYRTPAAKARRPAPGENGVQQLEDELKVTREELQGTIEQLEGSNDQLKASNEEVTASNEELQSANEELETSKEELQSLNEELNTINARLQEKVDELETTNNDVINLLSSTSIATVFLDKDLKVRRYTPAITRLFSLIPSDIGRPVADILRRFSDEPLLDDARRVLTDLTPVSEEVPADDGRWYIRRITPYRTQDDRIEGVVLTFAEVSGLKRAEQALRKAHDELEIRVQERTEALVKINKTLEVEIAERKRTEAALKTERQRLHDVLDMLPAYVVLLTPDYHVPFANRFFRERFGESGGRRCFEYLFNRTEPCEICETYTVLKTHAPHHWEWLGPDGRNYDIFDFPFTDADGSPLIMEMGIDITELKKSQNALLEANETLEQRVADRTAKLAESEARYRNLFETMSEGFAVHELIYDADGNPSDYRFLEVNPAFERLTGLKSGEVLGRTVREILPGTEPEWLNRYSRVVLTGEPDHFESFSGELNRWYEVFAYPMEPDRFAVMFLDITGRKQSEEAIRRAKEEWEKTFDSVPDLIVILDEEHRVVRANKAMAHRLGCTPKECIGLPCYKAVHGTDAPPAFCPHTKTLADGREHAEEIHEERLGGHFLVTTTPIADETGKMTGSVHVARDITELKQAEQERETAIEFLQIVNNSRSAHELIRAATTFFKDQSGCQAVGIRLRKGDDYPYYEARGFSKNFILTENSLCAKDKSGNIIRGDIGEPVMECMCGNVICGRVDPSKPFFTPHGTFWTNSTTRLPASITDMNPQTRTRNRCNSEGYESVALLPLSVGGERLGLLQLNDPRKDIFSPEIIRMWERLTDYLAVALAKFTAEESLRENREDLDRAQAVGRIGSWRLNVRRNELLWSDENHRIFGIPKGTPLTYEAFLAIVHPDDREYVDRMWNAGLKGEPYDIEHRIIADEKVKWV